MHTTTKINDYNSINLKITPLSSVVTISSSSESEIISGIKHAYWQERQIVEGSGAVSIAALISRKISPKGTTVALMCGSNIDLNTHHKIISGFRVDI